MLIIDAIQAVNLYFGQPGKEIEEGNARIAKIVVGPFRRVARDE
jgi:hypothetical protein